LKTMYYCRSEKIGKFDKVSQQIQRQIIEEIDMNSIVNDEDCLSCEG
jgi:ribonucleoside-diphosphate reductase alpha chain